jgi:hypothetical protein
MLKLNLLSLHFNLEEINFINLKNRKNNFLLSSLHIKNYRANNKSNFSSSTYP